MSGRKNWIDALRAFAMLLVVIGHTPIGHNTVFAWISTVKMPLFFAVSGYLLRENETRKPLEYLKHLVCRLLIPYLAFSVAVIPIYIVFNLYHGWTLGSILVWDAKATLRGDLIWFLPCLFLHDLLLYFIRKIRPMWLRLIAYAGGTLLGYFLLRPYNAWPWRPEIALYMLPFALLGRAFARRKSEKPFSWAAIAAAGAVAAAMHIVQIRLNLFVVDVNCDVYSNHILNMITGLCGVAFLFMLFPRLPDSTLMLWIGKNTLVIYVFHAYPAYLLGRLAVKMGLPSPADNLLVMIAIVILCLLLCVIPIRLIDRFCPWMLGRRKK